MVYYDKHRAVVSEHSVIYVGVVFVMPWPAGAAVYHGKPMCADEPLASVSFSDVNFPEFYLFDARISDLETRRVLRTS